MKKDIFNILVPASFHGFRIDKFLQLKINEISRTRLQALIHENHVKINNIVINNSSKKIKGEDKIQVNFPPPKKNVN